MDFGCDYAEQKTIIVAADGLEQLGLLRCGGQ